jgi:hypothetical protein
MTDRATAALVAAIVRLARAAAGDEAPRASALAEAVATANADAPALRLLAATYPRLRGAPDETPLITRARIHYLSTWAANRALITSAAPVLDALAAAGCRPILLKGLAVLVSHFGDLGVRRVGDVDVLVDPSRAEAAWNVLEGLGGRPFDRGTLSGFADCRAAYHGLGFWLPGGLLLDLHWTPLADCCSDEIAERFIGTARQAEFGGLSVLTPSPEHLVLHACVHGARPDLAVPGRWLLDVATIVATSPELDWAVVWDVAHRAGVTLALDRALGTVAEVVGLPDAALANRGDIRAGIGARLELWAWRHDKHEITKTPLARIVSHVSCYHRLRHYHPHWRAKGLWDYWQLFRAERTRPVPPRRPEWT